jgi:excisionase family DNA binding protein
MRRHVSLDLTTGEVARAFADRRWAEEYPPVLSVEQAAQLIQVPPATIYAWSSAGRLDGCAVRAGKHLRIWRDRFIQFIFQ